MVKKIKIHYCIIAILSSSFLAFGMYNIHALSGVTEGGILGLTLLFHNWFGISPAISGFVMNFACYLLGWRLLGRQFVVYSAFSATGYSVAYRICEQFEPLWPQLYDMPLLAAVIGALFVGIGAGICVRIGGAVGGIPGMLIGVPLCAAVYKLVKSDVKSREEKTAPEQLTQTAMQAPAETAESSADAEKK